jgi:hypothetical protein
MPLGDLWYLVHHAPQWPLPLTFSPSPEFARFHRGRKRRQFDRIQGIGISVQSILRNHLDARRTVDV